MSREYIKALNELKEKWDDLVDYHWRLHPGPEHLPSLEEKAFELKKVIVDFYNKYRIDKIGKYDEQQMLNEVNVLMSEPSSKFFSKDYDGWDVPSPPREVVQQIEFAIRRKNNVQQRLLLDMVRSEVFDGSNWISPTDTQLKILEKLNERPGSWVPGSKLKFDVTEGERPDKIIKALPKSILKHIKSHTRNGYKLI